MIGREDTTKREAFRLIADRFRVLGEPMRLRILHALGEAERSVTEVVDATGAGQANVSKHLGVLLRSGLVARRREGMQTIYRVADPSIFALCDLVCSSLDTRFAEQRRAITEFARE